MSCSKKIQVRGLWGTRQCQIYMAEELVEGYLSEIKANQKTNYIKNKELEDPDWYETTVTGWDPSSWYPGGMYTPENYQGPKIKPKDHYYCKETVEAWRQWKRAEWFCDGKDVEYGTTSEGNPYVRMILAQEMGKSMWYPLN